MAAKSNLISQLNTASILNSRIQTIHGKISTVNMKYSAIHMLTFFTARRYFSTIYWHDYHKMAQALLPELWAWLLRNGRRNVNTLELKHTPSLCWTMWELFSLPLKPVPGYPVPADDHQTVEILYPHCLYCTPYIINQYWVLGTSTLHRKTNHTPWRLGQAKEAKVP